jgi:hypothetical protein
MDWRFPDDDEYNRLLTEHGYNPALSPRGISGGPGEFDGYRVEGNVTVPCKLRNWVCVLDGVLIDGHSDQDNTGLCVYCSAELD